MSVLRVAGIVEESIVDGPGLRLTIFLQGCPRRCPGCHNPDALDDRGGTLYATVRLLDRLDRNPLLQGVTLSGGEPFSQARELLKLCKGVKERHKDLWCYTGYIFEELTAPSSVEGAPELLQWLDVLVDGPYLQEKRNLSLRFRGSENQRLIQVQPSLERGVAVTICEEEPQ